MSGQHVFSTMDIKDIVASINRSDLFVSQITTVQVSSSPMITFAVIRAPIAPLLLMSVLISDTYIGFIVWAIPTAIPSITQARYIIGPPVTAYMMNQPEVNIMLDRKRQYLRPQQSANWTATSEPIIPVKGTIHELSSFINLSGILRALTISVRTEASAHPLTVPPSNMVNVAGMRNR